MALALTPGDWPRWQFMWLVALAVFAGCKWLTWQRSEHAHEAPWQVEAAYLFAWPGLDANAFSRVPTSALAAPVSACECLFAAGKTLLGVFLFWVWPRWVPDALDLVRGWIGMAGVVFLLHFGTFHLLSCFWRCLGRDARPLMNWPVAATSVADFWGRRWNTAFRDLTHRFLFQPLAVWLGPRGATMAGFAVSGLLHDLVISIPAGGGYGLPTCFFLLQGAGLLAEHSTLGRKLGLRRDWRGRLFAMIVVAGPAVILFHPPFVRNVVLPFMTAFGAT